MQSQLTVTLIATVLGLVGVKLYLKITLLYNGVFSTIVECFILYFFNEKVWTAVVGRIYFSCLCLID